VDYVFIYMSRLGVTAYTIRQSNQSIIGVISIHQSRIYLSIYRRLIRLAENYIHEKLLEYYLYPDLLTLYT
jgi:hypothetical protein